MPPEATDGTASSYRWIIDAFGSRLYGDLMGSLFTQAVYATYEVWTGDEWTSA